MPSARQAQVLQAVRDIEAAGRRPTIRRIAEAIGLRSKCSVHRMCAMLVEQGWLRRDHGDRRLSTARIPSGDEDGEPASDHPLVMFIHHHQIKNGGASPSRRMMRDALGLRSMSMISRMFQSLVDQGFIVTAPAGNRTHGHGSIEVVRKARPGS